jgi:hypothetical protein
LASLGALRVLFDEADKGNFPTFWKDARVSGIPKKGSTDRKPLTIMSQYYRIWARRKAKHLGVWFNDWAPSPMFGGRIKIGAADAATLVAIRVERSRLGLDQPIFVASTDMEK